MKIAAALIFIAASGAPLELHILRDGNVRFADGPELDLPHLKSRLVRMAEFKNCPDIRIVPEKTAAFAYVAAVLKQFQQFGCSRIGFTGVEKSN